MLIKIFAKNANQLVFLFSRQLINADSSHKCNTWKWIEVLPWHFKKYLQRTLIIQRLSRTVVHFICCHIKFLLSDAIKRWLLGKILSQQPIVVFVETALPWWIRIGNTVSQSSCCAISWCWQNSRPLSNGMVFTQFLGWITLEQSRFWPK